MTSRLANPTKYHVIQKQKNQVKQYLSESFKSSESLHNLIPYPVLQHNHGKSINNSLNITTMAAIATKSQPVTTCNSPLIRSNVNAKLLNHVAVKNGLSHSANEMAHVQQSLEYGSNQSASNNGSFQFNLQHRYNATASPSEVASSAMSPTISSVATSVTGSEVSLH